LAGCQVSPLYGDRSAATDGRSATATALSAIVIDAPADRTTQLVRNELVFGLDSGAAAPQYRLALRASSGEQTLGVSGTGAAFARTVRVTASYQLFALGEAEPLAENTVISTASYDSVEQRFANQRAAIDAEARAARDVARVIEAQLAAAFATGS
jgi:LPS-assembly lipoprotein